MRTPPPFLRRTVAAATLAAVMAACGDKTPEAPATQQVPAESTAPAGNAVLFEANQTIAVTGPEFINWRDQMIAQGGEGKVLEVTGRAYANEKSDTGEDLGQARAEAASILFMEKLDPERIVLKSAPATGDAPAGRFEAVSFQWVEAPAAMAAASAPAGEAGATTTVAAAPAPAPAPQPAPTAAPAPTPAPAEAPAAAPAAVESVRSLVLYFNTGSSQPRLSAAERKQLQALVATAGTGNISVTGHADNVGVAERNQSLSAARAESVKRLLMSLGAKADAVQAGGEGDRKPAGSNDDAEGRAKNRRVEIAVM